MPRVDCIGNYRVAMILPVQPFGGLKMAENTEVKTLELRIVELENQLKQMQKGSAVANITTEELNAFQKVRQILQPLAECTCGPCACDTLTRFPSVGSFVNPGFIRVCVCLVECTCGPCNIDPRVFGQIGGGRFGNLGGGGFGGGNVGGG